MEPIPLADFARAVLQAWKKEQVSLSPYLFPSSKTTITLDIHNANSRPDIFRAHERADVTPPHTVRIATVILFFIVRSSNRHRLCPAIPRCLLSR
jgi:hypothetical protein